MKRADSYGRIGNCDVLLNYQRTQFSLFPEEPGARDDARAAVIEKVKEMITRFGGNVTDVDEWGKRRFAYEIQKMKEGFYYFVHFESDASVPGEIEQRIRIMDNVLRYLCVRQEA